MKYIKYIIIIFVIILLLIYIKFYIDAKPIRDINKYKNVLEEYTNTFFN